MSKAKAIIIAIQEQLKIQYPITHEPELSVILDKPGVECIEGVTNH
jgi:hypothetical protein